MLTQGEGSACSSRSNVPKLLVILGAFASLYLSCFRFPLTPIWEGFDQFGFIAWASRLWAHETLYRDFFYVTPPGHEMIYLLFFRVFGQRNWIPNADWVLAGVALAWLTIYIGRKFISSGWFQYLLPAPLFLAYAYSRGVQDSHRWLNCVAVLAAVAVIIEERTLRRLVVAGVLCGIASFFTQTQGVFAVAGLVTFLFWEAHLKKSSWRKPFWQSFCLGTGFVVTGFATNAYFIWKAGLKEFLFWTVTFPAVYFPHDRLGGSIHAYLSEIPHGMSFVSFVRSLAPYLLIYVLVPFVYVVFLIWYKLRGKCDEETIRAMLVNIVGLFIFAGVAPSPSFFRLATVSAPALILFVYLLQGKWAIQRIIIGFLWIAAIFSMIHRPLMVQGAPTRILQLPRGPIAFSGGDMIDYQLLDWLSSQTRPGDIFFSPNGPGIFYPLALKPMDRSTAYDDTDFTRPQDVDNAIATLEAHHARFIWWPPAVSDPGSYRPQENHLGPLRKYVQMQYHLVKQFGSGDRGDEEEIWMTNP